MKKLMAFLFVFCVVSISMAAVDSLMVQGRVVIDGKGIAGADVNGVITDQDGYFSIKVAAGEKTVLTPRYRAFHFDPPTLEINGTTANGSDTPMFSGVRQPRKTIIISGQSNAENVGDPKYFVTDTVDAHIPYYLAYCMGDYGLSTLGLLTKFGKSSSYCYEYNCGFGLEMLLARTLYKNFSDSLAVIKLAYSGTALYDMWKPSGDTWNWFTEKHNKAVTAMQNNGYEPEYVGVFWFQGESDEFAEYAPHYADNLYEMVDRMRARFPNASPLPELPFICVEISWDPSSPYEPPIQEAQRNIAANRDYTACINIDDCLGLRYSSRNMHFSGAGLNRIGYKLATQYLDMIGTPIDSNVTVSVDIDEMYDFDTDIVFSCEGDTSFTHVMTDLTYDFPARYGDSLVMTLIVHPDYYTFTPASRSVDFLYDQTVLKDKTYSFNVDKLVAIRDYPEDIDHVLMTAYPNPFNPATVINFQLPESGKVALDIFDLSGRKVEQLVNMPMEKGAYKIEWNAATHASGVYISRLQADNEVIFQKLTLLK